MENTEELSKTQKKSKFYTISIIIIISILLVGFIFMSLILRDIFKEIKGFSKDSIEFIRDFFDIEIGNLIKSGGVYLFHL